MPSNVWLLKYRDTRPVLRVVLHDPAPAGSHPSALGPVHNLTGSTSWHLHIKLANGTRLTRPMSKVGADVDGTLEYVPLPTDWDVPSNPDADGAFQVGGFAKGEHDMEYEVIGPANARLTFPNGDEKKPVNDKMVTWTDIGQGT